LDTADSHVSRVSALLDRKEYAKAVCEYKDALLIDPKCQKALNGLAWLLATCPDSKVRDGGKAVEYARQACTASSWTEADALDTLAAAHAECGDFHVAVEWQKKALRLAAKEKKTDFQTRLELYKSGKPYRQSKP
jgi:tetratricopeptide (TPR) repeat protein